jgi:hypothetical protein
VLPQDLAVFDLEACQITALANDVEPFAIDRRRASGALFSLRHSTLGSRSEGRHPQFLAIRLGQCPDDLVVIAIAHAEDLAGGDGWRAVAPAKPLDPPCKRWAFFWPRLKQSLLLGDRVAVGALPLRPIERPGGRGWDY